MGDVTVVPGVDTCWLDWGGVVVGLDRAAPVYPDPVWTMRDVLLHCAFWNDEVVKAIAAFRAGGEYLTDTGAASFAEGLDAMNARVIEAARSVPEGEVRGRWIAAQDALTDAVRALDADTWAREIVAPWGEGTTVEQMVDDELGHEQNHIADVVTAVSLQESDA
jgi:hypothetical protein